jgi:hypothetical protein
MLVWALVVGLMDNFCGPILIRRGADLPLLLIFAGVIGGLVAFGIVGIFVGPVSWRSPTLCSTTGCIGSERRQARRPASDHEP